MVHELIPWKPLDLGFQLSKRSKAPLFTLEKLNFECARRFARFRTPSEWNDLPLKLRAISSITQFKHSLYEHLLAHEVVFA